MKKFFTLIACALAAISASATSYTGKLNVNINGYDATPTTTTISVDKADDGTYNLQLKNFTFVNGADAMPVGNINISGVKAQQAGSATILMASQTILIDNGDDSSVQMWFGPQLGPVPVEMVGALEGDKFHTVINIDFQAMEMDIAVEFATQGDGYQLPNSGFENYHTATYGSSTGNEANGWHNFLSGQGTSYLLAFSCGINTQNENYSTDVRPGSIGEKSLLLQSKSIMTVPANGTVTTGRLNVGSMSAANAANYSFNNLSMTDTDANGDPFYAAFTGHPDSLTVWVKFKQGKVDSSYPYASVSAVLNNGDEYRDPEVQGYTSGVVAKAANRQIESKDFQWQRLTIPFDYDSYTTNAAEAKALLVTISTNATPGKGSGSDQLLVDDIALVYNAQLSSLKYDGQTVTGFSADEDEYTVKGVKLVDPTKVEATANGRGTYIVVNVEEEGTDGVEMSVSAISEDLKTVNTYYISFPDATGTTTAISSAAADTATAAAAAIYNAAGQRTSAAASGLRIVRQQSGKTVKVLKK